MIKRIYFDNYDEMRRLDFVISQDWLGEVINTEKADLLGKYIMTIKFEDRNEQSRFCRHYGYRTSRGMKVLYRVEA